MDYSASDFADDVISELGIHTTPDDYAATGAAAIEAIRALRNPLETFIVKIEHDGDDDRFYGPFASSDAAIEWARAGCEAECAVWNDAAGEPTYEVLPTDELAVSFGIYAKADPGGFELDRFPELTYSVVYVERPPTVAQLKDKE